MSKPLPYSRQITPMATLLIYFGGHDAWKQAQRANDGGLAALVLPVGQQPNQFDWSIFRGRTLLAYEVSETSREYRRSIVAYAANAGAVEVYAHSFCDDLTADPYFIRGAA